MHKIIVYGNYCPTCDLVTSFFANNKIKYQFIYGNSFSKEINELELQKNINILNLPVVIIDNTIYISYISENIFNDKNIIKYNSSEDLLGLLKQKLNI